MNVNLNFTLDVDEIVEQYHRAAERKAALREEAKLKSGYRWKYVPYQKKKDRMTVRLVKTR